jgi:large subunit ribosomal protein L3
MVKALLGKKVGMTQIFDDDGSAVPVTVLQVGPCYVVQPKEDADGKLRAVQIGFDERKRKNTPKPLLGHFAKAGVTPKKVLRDVEPDDADSIECGQELGVLEFKDEKRVTVTGTSKGRGFAGVIKRHGFRSGPATHGSNFHRVAGSVGSGTDPGRIIKGRKMPGHMGAEKVTVRNLEVVKVIEERNVLLVKGAVPGCNGGYVLVRKTL